MRIFRLIITILTTVCMCFPPVYAADEKSSAAVIDVTDDENPLTAASGLGKLNIEVTGLNGGKRIMLTSGGTLVIAEENNQSLFVNGEEKNVPPHPKCAAGNYMFR